MSLKGKVIKLAHEHPEFRGDLLPILASSEKTAGVGVTQAKLLIAALTELVNMANQKPAGVDDMGFTPEGTGDSEKDEKAFVDAKAAQDAQFAEVVRGTLQTLADTFRKSAKMSSDKEVQEFLKKFYDLAKLRLKMALV